MDHRNQLTLKRVIDNKLAQTTDAIESVGVSHTLARRLADLKRKKAETKHAIENVSVPVQYHSSMVTRVVEEIRALAECLETISSDPRATLGDIEGVRANLRALLGPITRRPDEDGKLWAYPNEKGPTEVRPLEGARINSPEIGSGGRI